VVSVCIEKQKALQKKQKQSFIISLYDSLTKNNVGQFGFIALLSHTEAYYIHLKKKNLLCFSELTS